LSPEFADLSAMPPLEPPPRNFAAAEPPRSRTARVRGEAAAWAAGRSRIVRAPLVLWLAWIGVRQFGSAEYASLLAPLNLVIHEAGHFVFRPFGEVMTVAGGSLLQCLAPLAAVWMFLRQPDWFGAAFSLGWLSTNFHSVGTYMADADAMRLPLVTVGSAESVTHDWRFLLERFDLLHRCGTLGAVTHGLAHLTMAASVAACIWLLCRMTPAPRADAR
jgi:hypothetical protein